VEISTKVTIALDSAEMDLAVVGLAVAVRREESEE